MKFLYTIFFFISLQLNAQPTYLVQVVLSKTVYADFPTQLEFYCDSCAKNYQISVGNGTLLQKDSVYYLLPNEYAIKCMIQVIDKNKRRNLGTFSLDVIPFPEPTVYIDSIASGSDLTQIPKKVSVGIDGLAGNGSVRFQLLSFQFFIEGFTPAWVTPGEIIEEQERNQIAQKQKDGKQTKVNVICQIIDHKNRIRNVGGWFYI